MTTSDINWPQTHQSNLFYHSPEPPPTPGTSHLFHNDFLALPISEPSYMYHPPDFHVDSITTFRSLLKCHFFKNSSLTIICKATKTYKSLVTSCPFCVCVCVAHFIIVVHLSLLVWQIFLFVAVSIIHPPLSFSNGNYSGFFSSIKRLTSLAYGLCDYVLPIKYQKYCWKS